MKNYLTAIAVFALVLNVANADSLCGKIKSISSEPKENQKGSPIYVEIETDHGTTYKPFIYATLVPLATAALAADLRVCVEKESTLSGDPVVYKMQVIRI